MNELNSWMQDNWYAFGNLFSQFAFLLAGVWFARKILRTMRASQEQFGALLKLSLTDGLKEQSKLSASTDPSSPYVLADWPATQAPPLSLPEPEPRSKRLAKAWKGAIVWLETPIGSEGPGPLRKVVRWLQTPAGN